MIVIVVLGFLMVFGIGVNDVLNVMGIFVGLGIIIIK